MVHGKREKEAVGELKIGTNQPRNSEGESQPKERQEEVRKNGLEDQT